MLEATMNDPIVETDNDEDKMKCSTMEIEESFEDMNEDTVETNNIEKFICELCAENSRTREYF